MAEDTRPSEQIAYDALLELFQTLPAQVDATAVVYDKKKEEIDADRIALEKERDALLEQGKPSSPPVRPTFQIIKGLDPQTVADPSGRRKRARAWIASSTKAHVDKILANEYWKYKESDRSGPYPKKAVHAYHLRNFQQLTHSHLIDIHIDGNPFALDEIVRIWKGALSMTIDRSGGPTGAGEKAREKAGVFLRFPYYENEIVKGASWVNSDEVMLERDLYGGTMAEVSHTLHQNDHPFAEAFDDFFLNHFQKRQLYLNVMKYGGKARIDLWDKKKLDDQSYLDCLQAYRDAGLMLPLEKYGHQLRHAMTGAFCKHLFSYKVFGIPEDKLAYEKLGGYLEADRHLIKTDVGDLLMQPHGNKGKTAELGWDFHDTAQDITYNRESHPHELVAYLDGSPFHTKEQLAALARSMHHCALTYGPKNAGVAATMGGHLPGGRNRNSERVIGLRGGKTYPSIYRNGGTSTGKALVKPKGDLELMQQVQRGHSFILSHLTNDPKLKEDLQQLTDAASAGNKAGELALLLFETERR